MKLTKRLVALFTMALFLLTTGLVFAKGTAPSAPVKISGAAKQPAATMDHAKHKATACNKCHHKGDEAKCSTCHKAEDTAGGAASFKTVAHKQCKDCHKKEGKGPTSCADCHKK